MSGDLLLHGLGIGFSLGVLVGGWAGARLNRSRWIAEMIRQQHTRTLIDVVMELDGRTRQETEKALQITEPRWIKISSRIDMPVETVAPDTGEPGDITIPNIIDRGCMCERCQAARRAANARREGKMGGVE